MRTTLAIEEKSTIRLLSTGTAGAVASFLTQPLEVIKTNRINSPSLFYTELHKKIIQKGWTQYMRGSSIAVVRQAYGFTMYTNILAKLQNHILRNYPSLNKFVNYSVSAVTAKLTAMIFEAPLTLLKTRVECVTSRSVLQELKRIMVSPMKQYVRGLGSSVAREGFYTLFHYNTYRYIKDDVLRARFNTEATFTPAFVAGIIAITVSQPFEVIRSQVSLAGSNESAFAVVSSHFRQTGLRGLFFGYIPRLVRKPINSGICWSILQAFRKVE